MPKLDYVTNVMQSGSFIARINMYSRCNANHHVCAHESASRGVESATGSNIVGDGRLCSMVRVRQDLIRLEEI